MKARLRMVSFLSINYPQSSTVLVHKGAPWDTYSRDYVEATYEYRETWTRGGT